MSPYEHARIMEYREKHKRCRTCEYAVQVNEENTFPYWYCKIKNKIGNTMCLGNAGISGVFCNVYKAKNILDDK